RCAGSCLVPNPLESTLTTHHSPLTTHHSPLTTQHSTLNTQHSTLKKASLRCRRLVAITSRSQRVQTTPSAETVGVNSSSSSCAFVQVANDLHYVMVFNRLDLIGKRDEPSINRIQFATRQLKPKSLTFAPKRMPPRMLPQYQPVVRHTYRLRRH